MVGAGRRLRPTTGRRNLTPAAFGFRGSRPGRGDPGRPARAGQCRPVRRCHGGHRHQRPAVGGCVHPVGGTARTAPRPPRRPASRRRLMAARYGRRRARIAFSDPAAKQPEDITGEAEVHALDRPRSGAWSSWPASRSSPSLPDLAPPATAGTCLRRAIALSGSRGGPLGGAVGGVCRVEPLAVARGVPRGLPGGRRAAAPRCGREPDLAGRRRTVLALFGSCPATVLGVSTRGEPTCVLTE